MENGHVIGFKSSVHVLKVESLIRSILRYTVIGREGALLNAIIVSSYKPIFDECQTVPVRFVFMKIVNLTSRSLF